MPITQILLTATTAQGQGGGGPTPGGDGTQGSTFNNGATYFLTPSTNGIGNPGTAYPGDVITWTINSDASQAGREIIWWVDNNDVPASNWVETTNYNGYANAGSVILDGNGSASFSLTVVQNPTHGLFRMYISDVLYGGWLTHGFIGV